MKFLPYLRPAALLVITVACTACATPANRRELYNTSDNKSGSWHDYDRRRKAEAITGISGGIAPSALPGTRGKATAAPPSSTIPGPLPPGAVTPAPAAQSPLAPADTTTAPVAPAPADTAPPAATTPDASGASQGPAGPSGAAPSGDVAPPPTQ